MGHDDAIHNLTELAIKSRIVADLSMIAVFLLDDPNYAKKDAAKDLVKIITDLESGTPCISLDDTGSYEAAPASEARNAYE